MGFEAFLGVNPWDAAFTLANTLTIFFVAKKFLWKPVMKLIADRQKEIDDSYRSAEEAKAAALTMQTEYRQKLDAAQEAGERIVKEAVRRGQDREEEILRQAAAEADALREKAAADIAREKRKAVNDAKDELSGLALAIAEKVVGRELKPQDQDALVSQFIDELGDSL